MSKMDQEQRIAYLQKNDWSTAPVPKEYRRSDYGVVVTLVGQIIALSGIYIGAGMVGGLTLTQAFIATLLGSCILAVLGGFLSWVGTKTGVGLSMLLRESFGTIGSYIVSVMLLLVAVGFFGYQATFFGATMKLIIRGGDSVKIKNIIPVTGPVITPEMIEYIRKYLSPDTELSTSQIKEGTPSIECEYDEAMAGPDVLRLCKEAEEEGCDGIFINCFGDPAVKAARELVDIPVFGGFEPAMHLVLGLADKIAIVSVMKNVLPMIEGEVARAHLNGRVCCVRSIDIPVEELQQHDRLVKALIEESIDAITADGAQAVALGCTAMVDVAEDVQAGLLEKGYDIPVIEAAQAAVMLLELSAKMGLKQSRITYMRPPQR